jgi:nitrite reductase/ring-hydroxylating ferredoxin subunit
MAEERANDRVGREALGFEPGFNEYLLGGVILLALIVAVLGAVAYLLPGDHLQIPELQPAARVASVDMPDSASRVITWGPRVVLVVRTGDEFAALQGTSPIDGCILEWDRASARVVSPCGYVVYDLKGNVVRGLTTVPLLRYDAFVRQGSVYVTEHR